MVGKLGMVIPERGAERRHQCWWGFPAARGEPEEHAGIMVHELSAWVRYRRGIAFGSGCRSVLGGERRALPVP